MNTDSDNPLQHKATGEVFVCPNCEKKTLEKFTGGVDIKNGEVKRTDFIYHCSNCNANYTQEEYLAETP